ncbi:carboxypeptidase regulatory-like domain-containing protein, partial [Hyalangium sp.]|uniref:carboxypeptidase regulatory-like domain-containing protein n=1 Tax=Hyalangium sp. TaxID=2028555 RepID=UPI002D3247EF
VTGLWFFRGEEPQGRNLATGAVSRQSPSPTRSTTVTRPEQAPGPGEEETRSDSSLEVAVFSGNTSLPGAQVQIYKREPADLLLPPVHWSGWRSGKTEADGRWVLPLPPGSYYVTARAPGLAPGYAAVVHPPGSEWTRARLRLEAGAELRGTTEVRGADAPVSFAEIILTRHTFTSGPQGRPEAPEEESAVATSSETGEFQLSGLAPGRYRVEARAPGYVSAVLPSVPIPFGARMTLELAPGGQLEGVVLRADGQPADGAEVLAADLEQATTVGADSDGRFSLQVPPGAYALSARRGDEAGALEHEVKVVVGQRVQGLRLQLSGGASISGKVVRRDSAPVVGARVEARRQQTEGSGTAVTDGKGSFSLPALAAGTYVVRVYVPGGSRFDHGPLTLAAGEHALLTLIDEPRGGLWCSVGGDQGPVGEGIRVRASALPATADRSAVEARTNSKSRVHFAGLPAGLVRVESPAVPSLEGRSVTVLVRRNSENHNCALSSGLSNIEGRVVERSGGPPDAPVLVVSSSTPESRYPNLLWSGAMQPDEQGRFRTTLPPGKNHYLSAFRRRGVGCGVSGQKQIRVEAGQRIDATIVLEDTREPALRLHVLEADGAPASLALVNVSTASLWVLAQTDEQGRLDVCLPLGQQQPSLTPLLLVSSFDEARAAMVEKWSGERELSLRLRPLPSLRGRVINTDGTPVRRFTVSPVPQNLWAHTSLPSHEFMGDQFELNGLPVGRSQILVSVDGVATASVVVDLLPEERKVLEIAVSPGVSVTGRVVDAVTRQPVAGASVLVPRLATTSTSPDGRFALRSMPVGEHLLIVHRHPSHRVTQLVKLSPEQDKEVGDISVP